MRLIDADALIESIKAQAGMLNWMLPEADGITDILSKGFIEQVNNMPTVPKWIPCSERLPNGQTEVIVSCLDDSGDTSFDYTGCGWCTNDGEYWIVDNEINNYVIAWMPLPEPYKGNADAN